MSEPDFSGIDPARLPEIRRRVELVRRYLGGARRAKDREVAAATLGVTIGQFMRLVRAWKEHGEVRRLHGAGLPQGERRRSDRLDTAVRAVMEDVIGRLGTSVRIVDALSEVRRHCEIRGLRPPAASTIHQHLQRAREAGAGGAAKANGDETPAIVVAPCQFRFPVAIDGKVGRAIAIVAALRPEGVILAADVGIDEGAPPSLRAVLEAVHLTEEAGETKREILVNSGLLAHDSEPVTYPFVITPSGEASRSLSALIGGRIGSLRIASRTHSDRDLAQQRRSRLNRPVTVDAAALAISEAIASHNAGLRLPSGST